MSWVNLKEDIEEMFSNLEGCMSAMPEPHARDRGDWFALRRIGRKRSEEPDQRTAKAASLEVKKEKRRDLEARRYANKLTGKPVGKRGSKKKAEALILLDQGYSQRQTAILLGVNHSTVVRWVTAQKSAA